MAKLIEHDDLVFVQSNLRYMSRKKDAYKTGGLGETRMWDVRGDSFDLFLIVANFAMHCFIYLFILKILKLSFWEVFGKMPYPYRPRASVYV